MLAIEKYKKTKLNFVTSAKHLVHRYNEKVPLPSRMHRLGLMPHHQTPETSKLQSLLKLKDSFFVCSSRNFFLNISHQFLELGLREGTLRSRKKAFGSKLTRVRFQPATAGWEARMLPLCYAAPNH